VIIKSRGSRPGVDHILCSPYDGGGGTFIIPGEHGCELSSLPVFPVSVPTDSRGGVTLLGNGCELSSLPVFLVSVSNISRDRGINFPTDHGCDLSFCFVNIIRGYSRPLGGGPFGAGVVRDHHLLLMYVCK
jgi:hypothetical protein